MRCTIFLLFSQATPAWHRFVSLQGRYGRLFPLTYGCRQWKFTGEIEKKRMLTQWLHSCQVVHILCSSLACYRMNIPSVPQLFNIAYNATTNCLSKDKPRASLEFWLFLFVCRLLFTYRWQWWRRNSTSSMVLCSKHCHDDAEFHSLCCLLPFPASLSSSLPPNFLPSFLLSCFFLASIPFLFNRSFNCV